MTSQVEPDNFPALWEALSGDVKAAAEVVRADGSQYNRRVFMRAFFAMVEGMTFNLKQRVLRRPRGGRSPLTVGEIAMLREENYTLNSKAQVIANTKYLPLDENFRFALTMFLHEDEKPFAIDTSSQGVRAFRESIRKRNRITHPRSDKDLTITDDDLATLMAAEGWFWSTYVTGMLDRLDHLDERAARLRALVAHHTKTKVDPA